MKKQKKQSKKEKVVYAVQSRDMIHPSTLIEHGYEVGDFYFPSEAYVSKRAAQRAAQKWTNAFGDHPGIAGPATVRELVLIG